MLRHYEIVYSEKALTSIDNVFDYMREHYNIIGSWLEVEDKLIEDFWVRLEVFRNELFSHIKERIWLWAIWVIEDKNNSYELTKLIIKVRSFNVTLHCKRYYNKKIVFIEDLAIRTK
jgi:hypothetical protein